MKVTMPWSLIGRLVGWLMSMLPIEAARDAIDSLIDRAEKAAQGKEWETAIMSACTTLREIIKVPDDDTDQSNPV